jgi:hypothetical protein
MNSLLYFIPYLHITVISSNKSLTYVFWSPAKITYFFRWFCLVWVMVLNATFNNISVTSWRSVLLTEETTDLSEVNDKLYHIMLFRVHLTMDGFELTILVVIGNDCTGNCKSNYNTITNTTVPISLEAILTRATQSVAYPLA